MTDAMPRLYVCTTCRAGKSVGDGELPSGAYLHAAVALALQDQPSPPVELHEVVCLSACDRGCSAAISMPGKWTYVLGDLSLELVPDLLTYAASYGASKNGVVMRSRRPASLNNVLVARVPPMEFRA